MGRVPRKSEAVSKHQPGKPPYLVAKMRIRQQVIAGRYSDRLPPERELAVSFGISYMTLRRAIGELVDEGLLLREVGRGTFVCKPGTLGRRTNTVALILPPHVLKGIANPYYAEVFNGIMNACEACGMTAQVATRVQELVPIDSRALHPGRKVDGIIGAAIDPLTMKAMLAAARLVPVVLLDCFAGPDIPCVLVDNIQGSRIATASLISLGHRRIAYAAGTLAGVGLERLEGYHLALAEADLSLDEDLVIAGNFEFGSGHTAAMRCFAMRPMPTAIVCANDAVALGVIRAAQEVGVDIPQQLSVVGFDDIEAARQVTPALSTMAVPRAELGETACRLLLERIADPTAALPPRTILPVRFVARGSSGPPRSD